MAVGALAQNQEPPIQPIVPVKQIDLGTVELGKKPYFDPRAPKPGFNFCQNLSEGGTETNEAVSRLERTTPCRGVLRRQSHRPPLKVRPRPR